MNILDVDVDVVDVDMGEAVRDVNGRGAKAWTCATASKVVKEAITLMMVVKKDVCMYVLCWVGWSGVYMDMKGEERRGDVRSEQRTKSYIMMMRMAVFDIFYSALVVDRDNKNKAKTTTTTTTKKCR
jgi:hypothetical protein